jgi:DNA-binding SARP family transcriptional activator
MNRRWTIHLLGDLRAEDAEPKIACFRTQKTGSLLGYLSYHSRQAHPRDALIEVLWPDVDRVAAGQKLRTALSSLRRQLEPPGTPEGAVIVTARATVRLNAGAIQSDVSEFDATLQTVLRAARSLEQLALRGEIRPSRVRVGRWAFLQHQEP